MILLSFLLSATPGVHIDVVGAGRLRFLAGGKALTAASATLAPNAQGLLADAQGRPVDPPIRVPAGSLRIAMNGVVTVSGARVGRLALQRPGSGVTDVGYPGQDGFAILDVSGASAPVAPTKASIPSTVTISVHATTELESDRVLLGDVADVEAAPAVAAKLRKIDLGALPSLGVRRTLGQWSVRSSLRDAGFPEATVSLSFPRDATVARKGQTIDDATLLAEATASATAFAGGPARPSSHPDPLLVPCGVATLSAVATPGGGADAVSVQVDVHIGGRVVGTRTVRFVAKTVGVRAGEAVRVTLVRAGIEIATDGKAKTAGRVGETVQVATPDGATLTATVTEPGVVEVKL